MKAVTIGDFQLSFEPGGKLYRLETPGGHQVLHRSDYKFNCGGGRVFVPGGWDECFPTIDPWRTSPVMGELIGWTPVLSVAAGGVRQLWEDRSYRVSREFSSDKPGELDMTFSVENMTGKALEFLWASHSLFTFSGLKSVVLPDGQELRDFSLNGGCSKSFVKAGPPVVIRWGWGAIRLETDQPYWGVWLNRGGWPAGKPADFGCIGIEATNTAGEAPAGARIEPGACFRGRVKLLPLSVAVGQGPTGCGTV